MSDPMTNSEVEDVLSSIRRLVSDEKRDEAAASAPPALGANRLVLTPSLRVPGGDREDAEGPAPQSETDENYSASDPSSMAAADRKGQTPDGTSESPLLLGDALPQEKDQAQGATEEDAAKDTGTQRETHDSDAATGVGADPAKTHATDLSETLSFEDSMTLAEKVAALETLIADRAENWEPDQAGAGENAGKKPPALDWDVSGPVSTETEAPSEDAAKQVLEGEDAGERAWGAETPAPQDKNDTPAQRSPQSDDRQPLSQPPQDHLQEAGERSHIPVSPNELEHGAPGEALAGVSEDALRKLVADVVRQELQGELGERVTRNIRKLVRRELHRALTAQDME